MIMLLLQSIFILLNRSLLFLHTVVCSKYFPISFYYNTKLIWNGISPTVSPI